MSRIDHVFATLRQERRRAVIPFITAGDPNLECTAELLIKFQEAGCPLVELGIPYSDPIADGPVIQASYTRALERGIRLRDIWNMLAQTADKRKVPLVVMCSYAIIYRVGAERFLHEAQEAGVAGAIVPDLLVEELPVLDAVAARLDFPIIQLVTPTTPRDRAVRIAAASKGFLYYVSVTGITGERAELPTELVANVTWLRTQTSLPICIGFGISSPAHVRQLAPLADGLIVGSAIVRRVAAADNGPKNQALHEVTEFVRSLVEAADEAVRQPPPAI